FRGFGALSSSALGFGADRNQRARSLLTGRHGRPSFTKQALGMNEEAAMAQTRQLLTQERRLASLLCRPRPPAGGPVDPGAFRSVLGRPASGVGRVTALGHPGLPSGLAVNSCTSVSLAPPLVSFCVAHSSTSWPRLRAAQV